MDSGSLDLQASSSAARMGIPGGREEAGETVVAAGGVKMVSEASWARICLRTKARLHERRMTMP